MRTAMVVGTATAVSGSVAHRQQKKYAAQDAQAAGAAPEAAPVTEAEPEHDDLAELTKLAELHSQGILTDEEFSAKKAKILGI